MRTWKPAMFYCVFISKENRNNWRHFKPLKKTRVSGVNQESKPEYMGSVDTSHRHKPLIHLSPAQQQESGQPCPCAKLTWISLLTTGPRFMLLTYVNKYISMLGVVSVLHWPMSVNTSQCWILAYRHIQIPISLRGLFITCQSRNELYTRFYN